MTKRTAILMYAIRRHDLWVSILNVYEMIKYRCEFSFTGQLSASGGRLDNSQVRIAPVRPLALSSKLPPLLNRPWGGSGEYRAAGSFEKRDQGTTRWDATPQPTDGLLLPARFLTPARDHN